MRITYVPRKFNRSSQIIIDQANVICAEWAAQGFDLTLRQLYYQFVARGLLPNKQTEYKRLGDIINDARLAGQLDWNYIVDRTRNLRTLSAWNDPEDIILSAARGYRIDKWQDQENRIEVWVEKDALVGVIEPVCNRNQVPYFACRGYTSQSEAWAAGRRLGRYVKAGQSPIILHLGDHDPSGMDMTRDITDRLEMFMGGVPVERLALNMDQIQQYDPPPNPAKLTDSRAANYIDLYGDESWELDALAPSVVDDLIQRAIDRYRDQDLWDAMVEREEDERRILTATSERFDEVRDYLDNN